MSKIQPFQKETPMTTDFTKQLDMEISKTEAAHVKFFEEYEQFTQVIDCSIKTIENAMITLYAETQVDAAIVAHNCLQALKSTKISAQDIAFKMTRLSSHLEVLKTFASFGLYDDNEDSAIINSVKGDFKTSTLASDMLREESKRLSKVSHIAMQIAQTAVHH